MKKLKIPPPISGGLMLSYKCSAECKHCMYSCSPKWKADWIEPEKLAQGLSQLAGHIQPSPWGPKHMSLSHGLHFSGGEPFMNYELLLQAVQIAEDLKIPSTFVETNCFWCKTDKHTKERLTRLKASGLKGIMISVNPFYAEFVPFERTDRCIRCSLEIFGQNVVVYQLEYYRQFKRLGIKNRLPIADFLELTRGESLSENVELFLMGRAVDQLQMLYPAYPAQLFLSAPCQPTFLRNWHNHFDNYGNFMPGFCGGLSLGSWFELDRVVKDGIDPKKYPVLGYLTQEDMWGFFNFAKDRGYRELGQGYLSKCHLCLDLRKFLSGVDNFEELRPKEFYHN